MEGMNRTIAVAVGCVFCIFAYLTYNFGADYQKNFLIVGILSAQSNFELRQSIRQSWAKYTKQLNIPYYFIVGKDTCKIPPEDRIDEYSCEELNIDLPPDIYNKNNLYSGEIQCTYSENKSFVSGFSFIVQEDIILEKFGIISNLLSGLQIRVVLLETASSKKIASATFLGDKHEENTSVLWKLTNKLVLPKGFEGQIIMESTQIFAGFESNCAFDGNSSGNIIRKIRSIGHQSSDNFVSPIAFSFTLKDTKKLASFIASKPIRQNSWNKQVAGLQKSLYEEFHTMKDILFVDVIDVYRNLPKKMLKFYEWLHHEDFLFFLKTDDDTFINIPLIANELQRLMSRRNESFYERVWWWSSFRENWAVQNIGKWREDTYNSVTYPPFPCGAGYVLSYATIQFLGKNVNVLSTNFGGEDVALGIWLAGINPERFHSVCSWNCDSSYKGPANNDPCNYPEITAKTMIEVYNTKEQQ